MTPSEQSTVGRHTRAFHADSSCQAAGLEQQSDQPMSCLVTNPRQRANSGMQDGRDFNNRGGERGRQPISFRSCEEDSDTHRPESRTGGERAARTVG